MTLPKLFEKLHKRRSRRTACDAPRPTPAYAIRSTPNPHSHFQARPHPHPNPHLTLTPASSTRRSGPFPFAAILRQHHLPPSYTACVSTYQLVRWRTDAQRPSVSLTSDTQARTARPCSVHRIIKSRQPTVWRWFALRMMADGQVACCGCAVPHHLFIPHAFPRESPKTQKLSS